MRALLREMFQRPAASQDVYIVRAYQAVPPPAPWQGWAGLEDDAQWLLVRLNAALRKQGLRTRRHTASVEGDGVSASVRVQLGAAAMPLLDGARRDLGEGVAVTIDSP